MSKTEESQRTEEEAGGLLDGEKRDTGDETVGPLSVFARPLSELPFLQVARLMVGLIGESFSVMLGMMGGPLFNILGIGLMNYSSDMHAQAGFGLALGLIMLFFFGFFIPLLNKMGIELAKEFGAKNYHNVKVVFNQAVVTTVLLFCIITLPIFLYAEPLLIWTGVPAATAEKAQVILYFNIFISATQTVTLSFQTHCFAQGVENVFAWKNTVSFVAASSCSIILVVFYNFGVNGWLIGRILYESLNFLATVITFKKVHPETLGFVSFAELKKGYCEFLWDSLQYTFSSYSEFLGLEVALFFIYRTPYQIDAAAFVCVGNFSMINYCFCEGFQVICRTRLNLLFGKKRHAEAKRFFICFLSTVVLFGVALAVAVHFASPLTAKLFASSTPELTASYRQLMQIYCFQIVFEVVYYVIAVGMMSIKKVGTLIFFNFFLLMLFNLSLGYWISVVKRLRTWYNMLAMNIVNYLLAISVAVILLLSNWEKKSTTPGETEIAAEDIESHQIKKIPSPEDDNQK